jgi:transcriptional regulator with XRE-family HTH domain
VPNDKRIDWTKIRAEYIAGGISQRKLAAKYGVSETTMMKKASAERWSELRKATEAKSTAKAQQKTANAVADNAVKAERIKSKLLDILERQIDLLPEKIGSTSYVSRFENKKDKKTGKTYKEKSGIEFKLRDLAAMYKDLTADMPQANTEETADDGFLAALNGKAVEIWADGDDNEQEDSDV